MADYNNEATMALSGSTNSKLRRAAESFPPYETRAVKKARVDGYFSAPAFQSILPPSPPPQASEVPSPRPKGSPTLPQTLEAPTLQSSLPSTPTQESGAFASMTFDAGSSPLSSIPTPESELCVDGQANDPISSGSPEEIFDTPVQPLRLRPRLSRSKTQADEEEEFLPDHDVQDGHEDIFEPEKTTKKPKSAGKQKKAPRKATLVPYHVNNQANKPEPYGQPEAWADKRQQLFETVPAYRAYQGSAYTQDGTVYGVLIDQEASTRDKFVEEVVITTVGGGKSTDETGKRSRKEDQPKRRAEPFEYNMKQKLPVIVIAGQGNPISPSKLPHAYNVLDWFHVTDVWAEKIDNKITWKVRLEKINLAKKSWWAVKESSPLPPNITTPCEKADSKTCFDCGATSKERYNAGWTCLEPSCKSFFQFEIGYDDTTLDYSEKFMKERTIFQGLALGPLFKPLPRDEDLSELDAYGYEWIFKRGIVCPKCGCCSRRILWNHWFCENSECDFIHGLRKRMMPLNEAIASGMANAEEDLVTKSAEDQLNLEFAKGGVIRTHDVHGPWTVNEYAIPDEGGKIIGFVRHFKSNGIINQQKDGPNDMFKQMQSEDFDRLRRNAVRQPGSVGEVLTSHFATNYGAKYKFGVKQASTGFDEAPEVILKTIKRLTWAGQFTVTNDLESWGKFEPFNECLAIGYFEGSEINYHDDGEKTLGPTIATYSFGADARMKFRPKANNTLGLVNAENQTGAPNRKVKKQPKEKAAVLQFTLRHGDIVIMHGPKIQKLYEHAVTPWGFRYALTCRYIIPEKMENEEERQTTILEGTLPPRAEAYTYDGDLGATEVIHSPNEVDKVVNDLSSKLKTGDLTCAQISELKEKLVVLLASIKTELHQTIEEGAGCVATRC